jgi:hypothetical protein
MSPRKRTTRAARAPLTFRGPPHHLSSLVALPETPATRLAAEATLDGAEIHRLAVRPPREGSPLGKVTLRLPRSTPPGAYPGTVTIAGEELPVVAEVEPRSRLDVAPSSLAFELEPGAEAAAEVTIVNSGNVAFALPAASQFCVFDGSGIDHAFWLAFTSDPPEGKQRVDVLLDDLADAHGGLVEVRARAQSRTIAPGGAREAKISFRFSKRIKPGGSYAGAWDVEGLHVPIRVTVAEPKRARRKAGAAR